MISTLPAHGNPEQQVYGLIGSSINTDEGRIYMKTEHEARNVGWKISYDEDDPNPSP